MPLYRFSRYIVTDAIDVQASSPAEAQAILDKAGVQAKGEFSHTLIEEVIAAPKQGYRQETSEDILAAKVKA